MPNIIQHKRSSASGTVPSATGLAQGELGINIADGKLYTKNSSNNIINLGVTSISGTVITPASGYLQTIVFNTNVEPDLLKGQVCWNDTDGTLNIAISDDTDIHVGEHKFYRVRNETGSILYKGQAVYATGVHSNGIIIPSLYTANGSVREVRFMGLMLENLAINNNGYVIDFGHLNIDTRGNVVSPIAVGDETWVAGDILYIHPTVAGKLTKVEPKHSISVAIVLNAASNGLLFVRPISYGHLNDNHDVSVSGATNGQFLQYNSSTDYWVPSSSGNFSTLLVNGTGVSLSSHTHSSFNGLSLGSSNITDNLTINVPAGYQVSDYVDNSAFKIINLDEASTVFSIDGYGTIQHGSIDASKVTSLNNTISSQIPTTIVHTTGNQSISGVKTFSSLPFVNGTGISISGHTHSSSDITNFNSSVSGLLPVKDIVAGTNIAITSSSGTYTINSTGGGGTGLQSSSYISQGKLNSNQSIGSSDTLIDFVDHYDPQGWWNPTTRRFQPTVAGYYLISFSVWWSASDATIHQCNSQIRLNGNTILIAQNQTTNNAAGTSQGGTKAVYMNGTTDYLDFTAYSSDTGGQFLQNGTSDGSGSWFTATFLAWSGPPIGTQNYVSKFGTAGSGVVDSLVFDNGTSVAINTNAPSSSARLEVNGNIHQTWSSSRLGMFYDNNYRMGINYNTSSRIMQIFSTSNDSNGHISFSTRIGAGSSDTDYGTERMRITNSGYVGIGTTTPSGQLHIAGLLQGNSIGTTGIIISNSHASQSANGQNHTSLYVNPTFLTSSSNLNNTYGLLISPYSSGQYTTTNSYGLYVNASTLVTGAILGNYAAVFMGGNVGVGTAAPSARLEVAASGTTSLDVAHFSNSNGVEKAKISLSSAGDGTFSIIDASNNTDIFFTSNTGTASYINAGNVGIGTITPSGILDVRGSSSYFGSTGIANNFYLRTGQSGISETVLKLRTDTSSNLYLDATNAYVKVGNQSADVDIAAGNAGIRIGNNSAQTLANQNIRLVPANTEIMRITPTGVGIGTTTPSSQLHVIGTGLFSSGLNIGNQTASTIASFDSNKNIVSLSTATYPSLTELGYVKGVTSSIQNQLNSSTIVRTTGNQTITGNKTFANGTTTLFQDGSYLSYNVASPEYAVDIFADSFPWAFRAMTYGAEFSVGNLTNLDNDITISTVDDIHINYSSISFNGQTLSQAALGAGSNGQLLIGNGSSFARSTLTAGTGISITNGAGSITVNSSLTNPVTGTGTGASTSGYLSRWNSTSGLNNSDIYQSGTNIGIGTVTPTSKLHVAGDVLATGSFIAGSGGVSNPSFEFVGDTDTGLFSPAANTFGVSTSGVERLRISDNGNIGINYSAPTTTLQVNGTFSCGGAGGDPISGGQGLYFDPVSTVLRLLDSGPNYVANIDVDGLKLYDAASNAFFYTDRTNARIGIGTASPVAELDVVSNGGSSNGAIKCNYLISNILLAVSDYAGAINGDLTIGDYTRLNHLNWNIDQDGNAFFNGNVGIGTTIPSAKLDVTGDVNIDGNLTFDSFTESVVAIGNSSTSKTIDLTSGTVQTCTLTGNCTFTMPTATAGKSFSLFLNSGSGNYTASFSGVRWADSASPTATITASKVDIYSFISDGTYWYGSFSQNYG